MVEPILRRRRVVPVPEQMPGQNNETFADFLEVYKAVTGRELSKDARILEFGAGKGHLSRLLGERGFTNVTAIDAEAEGVGGIRRARIEDWHGDYDVLIGLNVFDSHHYTSQTDEIQRNMVAGTVRSLKPNGFLLANGDIERWAGEDFGGFTLDFDPQYGIEKSKVTAGVVLRKLKTI